MSFKGECPDVLLTRKKVEDHEGASLAVNLLDESGNRVEVGPESCVKVKYVVLDGDFEGEDTDDWTEEDFQKNIVTPKKDRGSLLKGNNKVPLIGGVASVCNISFTDNSKTIVKSGRFRLGVQVIGSLPSGVVVRSAVSKAFRVKEGRLEGNHSFELGILFPFHKKLLTC